MPTQSRTLMRCERCRAAISSADASDRIRHGVACGVCGGTLTLPDGQWRTDGTDDPPEPRRQASDSQPSSSP